MSGREQPRADAGTLVRLPQSVRGRRRSAPKIERSSDVTRTRGWLVGSLTGALGLLAALSLDFSSGAAIGASGRAISRPHRIAGLDCSSCHADARPGPATDEHDPADACLGCHREQRSQRAPHAALLANQTMRCTTCHQIHTAMGGVAFVPGEPMIRWRNGGEGPLPQLGPIGASGWSGRERADVALVELSACATCHEPTRADDPMAHCALAGHRGPTDIAVCFDEHTPLLVAAGTERAALWELSRDAAVGTPTRSQGARGPRQVCAGARQPSRRLAAPSRSAPAADDRHDHLHRLQRLRRRLPLRRVGAAGLRRGRHQTR